MAGDPLRITLVTPECGAGSRYQPMLQQVAHHLRTSGHQVNVAAVRRDVALPELLNRVPSRQLERSGAQFLSHLAQLNVFRRLDVSRADVVISTLPPSQAIQHDRHLALFFHHDRPFYDLSDLTISSGAAPDGELHRELASLIRAADQPGLKGVTRFSVPSRSVQQRLHEYNQIDQVLPFSVGVSSHLDEPGINTADGREHVLCVGPHELAQRTELFVQAAHLVPDIPAISVGDGSRFEWVQRVDRGLDRVSTVEPEKLWRRPPDGALPIPSLQGEPLVQFIPWARRADLDRLYRQARCLVAPAIDEDYGFAVLDAMAWGVPAVACTDGGGLAEMVEVTGCGLVVAPEPRAIAEAVRKLGNDTDLAAQCRAAGLAAVEHRYTWERTFDQLDFALAAVMDAPRPPTT